MMQDNIGQCILYTIQCIVRWLLGNREYIHCNYSLYRTFVFMMYKMGSMHGYPAASLLLLVFILLLNLVSDQLLALLNSADENSPSINPAIKLAYLLYINV